MCATRYVQPTVEGLFHGVLGSLDDAFAALDRACVAHDLLPVLNYFPSVSPLKQDLRWRAIFRRIGVVPAAS